MADNPGFPRVGLLSPLAPVDHPQTITGAPMRLPAMGERPAKRTLDTLMYAPPGLAASQGATGQPSPNAVETTTFEAHRYANIVEGNLTPGLASAQFLQEPSGKRNFLGFRNGSAAGGANIFISFGRDASTASWLVLVPGQIILMDTVVPQDDCYCIADAAGAILTYAFSTFNPQ